MRRENTVPATLVERVNDHLALYFIHRKNNSERLS
jgi:hypothetical protein